MKRSYTEAPVTDYVSETDWYRFDIDTLCRKLGTDKETGLDVKIVKKKKEKHEKNVIFPPDPEDKDNAPKTAFSVLSVLLIIMLVLAGILLKDKAAAFGILLTAAGHVAIYSMFGYGRKFMSSLSSYSVPEVRVVRGGKTLRINQNGIVQGDLIYLSEGDLVPCDGRIVYENGLRVLEKNISGGDGSKDADYVERMNGLDPSQQKNMVFARSAISEGSCMIIACDTGSHTLPVRRGIKVKSTANSSLDVFGKVSRISRVYAVICSAVLFTVTVFAYATKGDSEIFSTFLLLLAVAASSYCERLCAMAYIAVTNGMSLRRDRNSDYNKGVIIKNLSAIKRLRELTSVWIPKTAGICEKQIVAEKIFTNGRELDADADNVEKLRRTVYVALSSFGGRDRHDKSGTALTQEQDGIIDLADRLGITLDEIEENMIPEGRVRADGKRFFDAAIVLFKSQHLVCLRGPAIYVVSRCTKRISNGSMVPLGTDGRNDLITRAAEYESMAYRVMTVASKYVNSADREFEENGFCFEGFIVMREQFSPTCADTVAQLDRIGVKTVMFCDDMTSQSRNLAKHLGICRDDAQMVTAPEFVNTKAIIIDRKLMSYRLFLGLDNEHKQFVKSKYLGNEEHIGVVGQHLYDISLMTGEDTVGFAANLTLSDKKAKTGAELQDMPYKVGGSEALKRAADVIILPASADGEGGINAVYEAILTARKVCNNIRNIICYLMASNVARLLIALISVFAGFTGMSHVQMIFSGIVIDLLAVICMCFSNNKKMSADVDLIRETQQRPVYTTLCSIGCGLVCGALAILTSVVAAAIGKTPEVCSTVCFTSLSFIQLSLCLQLMRGRFGFFDGLNNALIISALSVLEYLTLSAIFPGFFSTWLTGTAYTTGIFLCIVPAVVFNIIYAVLRAIKNGKIKKVKKMSKMVDN